MSSDCDGILFGGPVTESLENAKSLGEFCLNRLRRHGESVLYVSKTVEYYNRTQSTNLHLLYLRRLMVTHQKRSQRHNFCWEVFVSLNVS